MAQPTLEELFGIGTTYNEVTEKLEIPKAALGISGLDLVGSFAAVGLLAAITKNAHAWLVTNEDELVRAASRLDYSAPFFRNEQEFSSFIYNLQFFGRFQQPEFDPDDVTPSVG